MVPNASETIVALMESQKNRVNILPVNFKHFSARKCVEKVMFTFSRTFWVLHQKWTSQMVRAWGFEPQRIAAQEPKGDVTLVNVLRCVKNTFLNNSNGYYRNAQVSSFVGDTIFLRISDKGSSLLIYFFTTILNSSFWRSAKNDSLIGFRSIGVLKRGLVS